MLRRGLQRLWTLRSEPWSYLPSAPKRSSKPPSCALSPSRHSITLHMNSSTDTFTPPGSPHEEPASSLPYLTRFTSLPEHHNATLPKTKSASNLLSQRSPASLSVNTKRMSIDAGQLDRMARCVLPPPSAVGSRRAYASQLTHRSRTRTRSGSLWSSPHTTAARLAGSLCPPSSLAEHQPDTACIEASFHFRAHCPELAHPCLRGGSYPLSQ